MLALCILGNSINSSLVSWQAFAWMSQISIMQMCCVFLNNMLVQLALTHSSFLYRMTVHRPICEVSKCARFCY